MKKGSWREIIFKKSLDIEFFPKPGLRCEQAVDNPAQVFANRLKLKGYLCRVGFGCGFVAASGTKMPAKFSTCSITAVAAAIERSFQVIAGKRKNPTRERRVFRIL
ncbi:hypothetical protein [Mesorhizobium sp. NPDC059025]|uniref:hypothetical protein n=1 Tax=unclassified Mesorhizobium TaxID=325217 RepID=UPI00368CF1DA